MTKYIEINGQFVEYIEKEISCSIVGYRKWIDNCGYEWITDLNNSFIAESESEVKNHVYSNL